MSVTAWALACALLHQPAGCTLPGDAPAITRAIDQTTDVDGLRAVLVVYSYRESGWQLRPRPWSWDAHDGRANGFLQLWGLAGHLSPLDQCRAWLANVQRGGLAGVSGYGRAGQRIAARRAREAQGLVDSVGGR